MLLFTSNLIADSVKILIEGNKRIDPETIKIYGEVGDKDDYSTQDINNILKIFMTQISLKISIYHLKIRF